MTQTAVLQLTTSNASRKKTREELISEHKKLENFSDRFNRYFIHNTCQDKSSLNLQLRISIANLQVGCVPINRFLICRVIARFVKINALLTLVEDPEEAHLRLDQFLYSLNDAEIILRYEPNHLKATYHKGKALCGLKHYQEAIITLRVLYQRLSFNTNHNIASIENTEQLLKHVELLASENEKGQYDFESIVDEYCEKAKIKKDSKGNVWVNNVGPRLDHTNYLIDDIEIGNIKGKGRSWIAKCGIPENTLLMVFKAFKTVYSHEIFGHTIGNIPNELTACVGSSSCHEELMISVIQKLLAEPHLLQEVYQLHDGSDLDKTSKINNKLVDSNKIGMAVKYNSFAINSNVIIENTDLSGLGLWILPSYFNHSCIDINVTIFFLGDLLFIRSLQPISKGEELIINYRGDFGNYELRSKYLQSIDVDCQCRLCKLDRSESEKTKLRRAQLLNIYKTSIKPYNANPFLIKELEKIIVELRSLRKEHPDLEFYTLIMSRHLSFAYKRVHFSECLNIFFRCGLMAAQLQEATF
ncbi:hypothetical protein C1645_849711 [Glomus cerebriforme]|uniref:SET domain-containing protein n=1 Tax=Glomus cerebriforme TaxID=658196 RepID=A0A397SVQ3_9GLOM|nr:hypothetical protein C1645_849711 [Glomus cerebriforme]